MNIPDEIRVAWGRCLGELQLQMTRATFDTWLRGSEVIDVQDGTWTVYVQHAYAIDWLENRLRPVIERTVTRIQPGIQITFTASRNGRAVEPEPEKMDVDELETLTGADLGVEAHRDHVVIPQADGQVLTWTDYYIKLKVAFRRKALGALKGAPLSTFLCLALHVDRDGVAHPGIEAIMQETGYGRATVCSALTELARLGLIRKLDKPTTRDVDRYEVVGYAWFGQAPAPSLWEEKRR